MGHALTENRHGLVVEAEFTHADGSVLQKRTERMICMI